MPDGLGVFIVTALAHQAVAITSSIVGQEGVLYLAGPIQNGIAQEGQAQQCREQNGKKGLHPYKLYLSFNSPQIL